MGVNKMEEILQRKKSIEFMLKVTGQKINQRTVLTELLKEFWLSAFQMQQVMKSSSADRMMRTIRENPPEGYSIRQQEKKIDGYNNCLEYKLIKNGSLF